MKLVKRLQNIALDLFDMVSFLVFVLWIVLFVKFFIANFYTVVGASMAPTFEENDFIVVDKLTQRFWSLHRGDVIVFVPPGKDIPYIKRIIAFPGETVRIKDGHVFVCSWAVDENTCTKLSEDYLLPTLRTEARCGTSVFTVRVWLFVMGDNRGFSTDSLCCFWLGCYEWASYEVPFENIIGKVYVRILPHFWFF